MLSDHRLAALDGLRGVAVIIVMLSHSSGRDMSLAPWLNFHGIGHIGVYLFFVLSGYLLTLNLLEGQHWLQFYLRRIFRIVPLYFCVLGGVLLYQASGYFSPRYLHISGGFEGALMHFLFLKGDSVFWTLAAEFGFYMLLPLLVYVLKRCGCLWLAVVSVVYFLAYIAAEKFRLVWVPLKFVDIAHRSQFLDVFACGILAAYLRTCASSCHWLNSWGASAFFGLLACTVIGVSANFLGAEQPFFELRWLSLVYGLVFGMAIICATEGRQLLTNILGGRFLTFIGKIGFGLYLLHFPVFQAVNAYVFAPSPVRFVLAIPLAIGCAWLAYQWIERPLIRLGRKIEQSMLFRRTNIAPMLTCQKSK